MKLLELALAHWDDITAALAVIGGLIWHRGKKLSLDDLWDTLLQLGRQVVPKLLQDSRLTDDAYVRARLSDAIWGGLGRLGVKHSKTIDKLVNEAVEHIHGELAAKLIDQALGSYVKTSEKTVDVLKAANEAPAT